MFKQAVISSLLALSQTTSALPTFSDLNIRQWIGTTPPPSDGPKWYCPAIDHWEAVDGEKWQTGNSAPSGASLSINTGYTAGTIIGVGADLGLGVDKLLKGVSGSAGISFSYSKIVTKTVTVGNNIDCPQKNDETDADYSCSLVVTPGYVKMTGRVVQVPSTQTCDLGWATKEGDWEMTVPRTDSSGNPFFYADACLCDGPGMDQENAPSLKCLEACTGVKNSN